MLGELTDTPVMANRVHGVMHILFRWAAENDLITHSPVVGVRAPNKERRARPRSGGMRSYGQYGRQREQESYPFGTIVQLLILTGQRRGEVAGMQWSELRS